MFLGCVQIGNIFVTFVIKPLQLFGRPNRLFISLTYQTPAVFQSHFGLELLSPCLGCRILLLFRIRVNFAIIFNEHFVNAGHLFENVGLLPAVSCYNRRPYVPVPQNSCTFSLQSFSEGEVLEALCGIGPKQFTGADKLNPGQLLLAAPLIVNILTHIFYLTLLTDTIPVL